MVPAQRELGAGHGWVVALARAQCCDRVNHETRLRLVHARVADRAAKPDGRFLLQFLRVEGLLLASAERVGFTLLRLADAPCSCEDKRRQE